MFFILSVASGFSLSARHGFLLVPVIVTLSLREIRALHALEQGGYCLLLLRVFVLTFFPFNLTHVSLLVRLALDWVIPSFAPYFSVLIVLVLDDTLARVPGLVRYSDRL